MVLMPGIRSILPRFGSSASVRSEAATERSNVLSTLQMLRNMGYRDVWVKSNEVTGDVINDARQQGWNVADVADGRVKFTLKWSDEAGAKKAFARTVSEAEAGSVSRPVSPAPPRSSMGSFHTVGAAEASRSGSVSSHSTGHTRSDSGSSGAQGPTAPLRRYKHRRGSSRSNQVMGGFHLGELPSPAAVSFGLRSPGGVSPSTGLSTRGLSPLPAPELRLTTPEGVESPAARPESGVLPAMDYFSFLPAGNTLTVVTEVTENSEAGSSQRQSLAEPVYIDDLEDEVVNVTRPLILRRAQSSNHLSYEDIEDLVPTLERLQTREDMMNLERPRLGMRVSLESLYSQEDEQFEYDPPRFRAQPPPLTRLPSAELVQTMQSRSSERSLRDAGSRPHSPARPSYTRTSSKGSSSDEPGPRSNRLASEATIRPKPSPPQSRGGT